MLITYGASEALHKLRRMNWGGALNTGTQAAGAGGGEGEMAQATGEVPTSLSPEEGPILAAVTLLLAAGADPNLQEERQGFWAPSAILWAVGRGYAQVAIRLAAAGAEVDENVLCAAAAQVSYAIFLCCSGLQLLRCCLGRSPTKKLVWASEVTSSLLKS